MIPITLRFIRFSLERQRTCMYDYLKIWEDGAAAGRYCGTTLPPDITAETGNIVLMFSSDRSRGYNGFTISLTGNLFMRYVIIVNLTICASQCL